MGDIRLIRAESDADLQRSLDLVARLYPEQALTLAELRGYESSLPHTRHLALDGDVVVGTAYGLQEPSMREAGWTFGSVKVAPEARGRGIGDRLLAAVSEWARSIAASELRGNIREDDPASLAWALARGFTETGRESRLELDLRDLEPPAVDAPPGIELATWAERPDAAEGLYRVYAEAAPDIPGEEDEPVESFDDWLEHHMSGPGDRRDATFVALADGEVVGYAKLSLTDAQPEVAYHDLTGVLRAWRGHGIAGALKRTQIRWAAEHGYRRLSTMNEERNAPIQALNRRYGYRPAPGRIFVRGPL